jgi:ABC-type transporter Mla subunit MlaD
LSFLALDDRLARRVGAVALALVVLAIAFFVFVWDRLEFGTPTRITVQFHQTGGLREGAPLVVAGHSIGHVESIDPVPSGASVRVAVSPGSAWKVPSGAEIFVASRGPLSERYLEVSPPPGAVPGGPHIREGDSLVGIDPPSIDSALMRTWQNMQTFQAFTDAVRPEASSLLDQLTVLQRNLDSLSGLPALASSVSDLRSSAHALSSVSLGGSPGLAHAALTISAARASLSQLRATVAALQPRVDALNASLRSAGARISQLDAISRLSAVLASLRAASDRLDPLLASAAALQTLLARGDGTIGRLMTDPEFPEDAKDLGKILKRHPWRIVGHPQN